MLGLDATKHPAAWAAAQVIGRYAGEWWKTTAGTEARCMEPDLLTPSELARVFTDGVRARSAARVPLSRQVALASPIEQALRAFDMCKWTPVTATIVSDEFGDRMSLLHGAPAFLKQRAADACLTQLVKAQVLGIGLKNRRGVSGRWTVV
jgi:hypothetical protein